ncbi:MAG: GC-type dockerin domain-anchored protein [Phycisphaerales bacterium JB064]
MRFLSIIAVCGLACSAQAQTIDFEDGFEGQSISTEYADLGVTFSTGSGTASISSFADYFGTLSICNATAGGAAGDRDLTLIMDFDPPIDAIEFDFHSAGSPGVDFPIRFYASGALVASDLLPQTGGSWFPGLVFDDAGTFDRIEIDSISPTWLFSVDNIIFESAACYADFDGDDSLTIFDFLAFQNAFDSGDPAADCDADGSLTLFDFLCFQNAFDIGCE